MLHALSVDTTIDMLHDAIYLCHQVNFKHPSVSDYVRKMISTHISAGDSCHAASTLLMSWKMSITDITACKDTKALVQSLNEVPKEEIAKCVSLLQAGCQPFAASVLEIASTGIDHEHDFGGVVEQNTSCDRYYAVRVSEGGDTLWFVYLAREEEDIQSFHKHSMLQSSANFCVDVYVSFLSHASTDGQLFQTFYVENGVPYIIQLCTNEVHPAPRRRLSVARKITTVCSDLDAALQWLHVICHCCSRVNGKTSALAVLMKDANYGTTGSSMHLKFVHHVLDNKRNTQVGSTYCCRIDKSKYYPNSHVREGQGSQRYPRRYESKACSSCAICFR